MQFTATLRNARIAPRKFRYVVDLIRGKDYNVADSILRNQSKRGVFFARKLLKSAFDNAANLIRERNLDIDLNTLFVARAFVNPGPRIKRWRPAPMGRALPIKKRFSHMIIVLEDRVVPKETKEAPKPAAEAPKTTAPQTAQPAPAPTEQSKKAAETKSKEKKTKSKS